MMKLSCGQSLAALPTSRTSEYSRRCGNSFSTLGGNRPLWTQTFVNAARMLGEVLVGVVADGVALHRIGLQDLDGVLDALHPPGVAGREDGVREHPLRAGQP